CAKHRHLLNLIITFGFSGLWHGANWTFVLWGLYHGILLCIESFYVRRLDAYQQSLQGTAKGKLLNVVRTGSTLVLAVFGWIFFRANNLTDLMYVLGNLHRGLNPLHLLTYVEAAGMGAMQLGITLLLFAVLAVYDGIGYYRGDALHNLLQQKRMVRYLFYWAMGFSILLALAFRPAGVEADFIYFQF
ncbi:MAG: hypothetical protein IJ347_09650, partial [Faecalibacterium sp.]|nr:hypothetical protein [Faecalibacterium sp.]